MNIFPLHGDTTLGFLRPRQININALHSIFKTTCPGKLVAQLFKSTCPGQLVAQLFPKVVVQGN